MCRKGQVRCPELVGIRNEAMREWCAARTYEEVRSVWSRLGGKVTLHRYGREHFAALARLRWSA